MGRTLYCLCCKYIKIVQEEIKLHDKNTYKKGGVIVEEEEGGENLDEMIKKDMVRTRKWKKKQVQIKKKTKRNGGRKEVTR